MRTNTLKRKLATGQRACGVLITFNNPEMVEVFGYLGYDFAYIDDQHCGMSPETARELMRAAEVTGMTSIVRIRKNDAAVILEYLDAGAGGIMVPDINGPEEAQAAVAAMKYPPVGLRSAASRPRAANYGITQSQIEYYTRTNDEVLFLPLIEQQAALPNLTAICATPGVDIVGIGPGDLAMSMGIPGGWKDPRVQAAVEQIRGAAAAAEKPVMIMALDPAEGRALYERGYQVLMVSAASLLINSAGSFLKEVGRN